MRDWVQRCMNITPIQWMPIFHGTTHCGLLSKTPPSHCVPAIYFITNLAQLFKERITLSSG